MSQPVLLDNTVLTNFALIDRADLVLDLWTNACTTPAVFSEYQTGVKIRNLPAAGWDRLPIVSLTTDETAFAQRLARRLGAGECSCIAVAYYRQGLFVSDDRDARQQATTYDIPVTGTIGILLLNVQQRHLTQKAGNELLTELIRLGYRSPFKTLDKLL
jgi:predicted nucleic acid-binding protein